MFLVHYLSTNHLGQGANREYQRDLVIYFYRTTSA
jgi:hypothetical protein